MRKLLTVHITKFHRERADHLPLHSVGGDGDARAADEEARVQLEGQGSRPREWWWGRTPTPRAWSSSSTSRFTPTHEQLATPVINVHLERYGLKMHVGTVAKSSKTEYMVIPPRRNDAIDATDLAPVKTDDRGRRRDLNGLLQVPRRGR